MGTKCLEAFFDGVIAITIMAPIRNLCIRNRSV
jgi:hypothetical protein